jgi:hypothetical protein
MYIDDLIAVFEQSVPNYSKLNTSEVLDSLRDSIEAKKYDLQDQGLIEAILREDKKDLVEDLVDTLEERTSKLEGDQLDKFLNSEDIKKEAIKIFIASLEHLINYYYNNVIGKHFSSS